MKALALAGEYRRALRFGTPRELDSARVLLREHYREQRREGHQTIGGQSEQLVLDPHAGMWLAANASVLVTSGEDHDAGLERDAAGWLANHLGLCLAGATPRHAVELPGARLPNDGDDDDGDGILDPAAPPVRFIESLALRTALGDRKAWKPAWQNQRYFLGLRLMRELAREGRLPEPRRDWQNIKLACPLGIQRTDSGHDAQMVVPPGVRINASGTTDGVQEPLLSVRSDYDRQETTGRPGGRTSSRRTALP